MSLGLSTMYSMIRNGFALYGVYTIVRNIYHSYKHGYKHYYPKITSNKCE